MQGVSFGPPYTSSISPSYRLYQTQRSRHNLFAAATDDMSSLFLFELPAQLRLLPIHIQLIIIIINLIQLAPLPSYTYFFCSGIYFNIILCLLVGIPLGVFQSMFTVVVMDTFNLTVAQNGAMMSYIGTLILVRICYEGI